MVLSVSTTGELDVLHFHEDVDRTNNTLYGCLVAFEKANVKVRI